MVTRAMWIKSWLRWIGVPVSKRNMWAMMAWVAMESGYEDSQGIWHPGAKWNPMNTTQRMPGSTYFNWNGGFPVQNYVSEKQGIEALYKTITQKGLGYGPILESLANGRWAITTMKRIEASQWGTHFVPSAGVMLRSVKHNWHLYADRPVGQ